MSEVLGFLLGIGKILGAIVNGAIDLIGKIPAQAWEWAIAIVFVAGIGWWGCRVWYDIPTLQAEKTAAIEGRAELARRDAIESKRAAADKLRLEGRITELKTLLAAERAADELATKNMNEKLARARGDNKALLAQLDLEKSNVERIANYCGSALTRVLYDQAAGADLGPGGISTPEAEAARTVDGAARAAAGAPPLSCVQLGQGYASLAKWGRETWARLTELQGWAKKASAD